MKLTVLNGSPRGVVSNTGLLLQHFLGGVESIAGNSHELIHLMKEGGIGDALAAFGTAEAILLAFPLYIDAMPAIVKELIEGLATCKGRGRNMPLFYMVQSGFPEGSHTRHLVPYLEKLSRRLGCDYRGTIRKGGVEGIRSQPKFMNRTLLGRLRELGQEFGRSGQLDQKLLAKLVGPDKLDRMRLFAVDKMSETLFWNPALRRNGAFALRYAKPLSPEV